MRGEAALRAAGWSRPAEGAVRRAVGRSFPQRRAAFGSVLCGEYSSTLRQVLFRSPHVVRPFSAPVRPGMGTAFHHSSEFALALYG